MKNKKIIVLADTTGQQELFHLAEEIKHHNLLYYQENKPEITDAEFDELKKKAAKIEEQFPEFSDNSQSNIGAEPDARFSKVQHTVPMLSLGNAYNRADLETFLTKVKKFLNTNELEMVCELKIDGLCVIRCHKIVMVKFHPP